MAKISTTQKLVAIKKIVANPNNPRTIKDHKFKQLVQSIKDFPEMLEFRNIIVDEGMMILGGNMRYKACQEAGLKNLEVMIVHGLTEEQKKEFVIKDNVNYGVWDWDELANKWNADLLNDWGLSVWSPQIASNVEDYVPVADDSPEVEEEPEEESEYIPSTSVMVEFELQDYKPAHAAYERAKKAEANIPLLFVNELKKAL